MTRFLAFRRAIAAFVLVVGTSVSALLPLADAYAEQVRADPGAHVESSGANGCAPVHDELACQLCRVLRMGASAPAPQPDLCESCSPAAPRNAVLAGFTTMRLAGAGAPRAPPAA